MPNSRKQMSRTRTLVALLAGLVVVSSGAIAATAQVIGPKQVPTIPGLPGTTTTTTAPPSGSTTTTAPPTTTTQPGPSLTLPGQPPPSTTTTTAPPKAAGPAPGAPAPGQPANPAAPGAPNQVAPAGSAPPEPDGENATATGPVTVPADYQAIINSIIRTKPNNTGALVEALAALQDFGLTAQEAAILGMGHFPVAGYAGWSDDWLFPRVGPPFHLHQGNDVFAASGTPIRAPFDGSVRYSTNRLGGLAVYLTMADGTYFYNAHLSATVAGMQTGQLVKQGTVIGFVGNSGNAATTPSHDHFEIHPQGGPAVNPKPYLDQWVAEALSQVPALVERFRGTQPKALIATGLTRQLSSGSGDVTPLFSGPTRPSRGQLLWASSMSPAGGALRLAEVEASRAADSIDWDVLARSETAKLVEWDQAESLATALLDPITPRVLAPFLEG